MNECLKCKRKLGLFSSKNYTDYGVVLCSSCFREIQEKNVESGRETIVAYAEKYLSGKDLNLMVTIFAYAHSSEIQALFDNSSLERVKTYFQDLLAQSETQSKSSKTSFEIDSILGIKQECTEVLNFLEDLEKIYKLLIKKGVNTDYFEILSCFLKVIKQKINEKADKILTPFYVRISNRLGENISLEGVIREFIKSPFAPEDPPFLLVSRLLDMFSLEYTQEEVERLIKEVCEEISLDDFERNFGSTSKRSLDDFENLTGYEFESYLKRLFELLGYTVFQTSLSGDQGADLILSKGGEKTVVQAKKYAEKVSNKAIQEIVAAKSHYHASKAIVVTNSSFTKSAIQLALSNNVDLWDGLKLNHQLQSLKTLQDPITPNFNKSVTLQKGKDTQKIKFLCPFCESEFEYEAKIFGGKVAFETACPYCKHALKASTTSIVWSCEHCHKRFNNKEETEEHEATCKKIR